MIMALVATTLIVVSDILIAPTKVIASEGQPATFQQFEHGFMLGIGGDVEVFPYNDKDRFAFAFSANDISVLKENAIANLPPQGDYQPTGDFGKLWSNSLYIMQGLGWAITPPIQYTAAVGAASGDYISLPIDDFSVKTNDARMIPSNSSTVDFLLLDKTKLHAGQLIWGYTKMSVTSVNCDAQRIQFQPDSYLGMITWSLGPSCKDYVFLVKAMAQQRMTISVLNRGLPVTGTVMAPDGTEIHRTSRNEMVFDGVLPVTGDYSIRLIQDSSGPAPIFQNKYESAQFQYSNFHLVVVIR
jgi:hypothetical protein